MTLDEIALELTLAMIEKGYCCSGATNEETATEISKVYNVIRKNITDYDLIES